MNDRPEGEARAARLRAGKTAAIFVLKVAVATLPTFWAVRWVLYSVWLPLASTAVRTMDWMDWAAAVMVSVVIVVLVAHLPSAIWRVFDDLLKRFASRRRTGRSS
ncbi:hypothetical protein [Burkholderia alba]|uniref:hypothetical protein n=1 Tax=Burkholderia alba TaxID=2683677 RepID=UPI002B06044A|nr:hypothetical protein [Burkholderia alba]